MTFMPIKSPFDLFDMWLQDAESSEPNDPNAMALATVDKRGRPAVRIVLLKGHDERGFCFFTNTRSAKGKALAVNQVAALNFFWKSKGRQIRIDGRVEPVSSEEADTYFASRPRGSRIGAWASQQSQTLENGRPDLLAAVEAVEQKYDGQEDIPRPPHWSGYRVIPDTIEFWQAGEFRLHDRGVYERQSVDAWSWRWLNP